MQQQSQPHFQQQQHQQQQQQHHQQNLSVVPERQFSSQHYWLTDADLITAALDQPLGLATPQFGTQRTHPGSLSRLGAHPQQQDGAAAKAGSLAGDSSWDQFDEDEDGADEESGSATQRLLPHGGSSSSGGVSGSGPRLRGLRVPRSSDQSSGSPAAAETAASRGTAAYQQNSSASAAASAARSSSANDKAGRSKSFSQLWQTAAKQVLAVNRLTSQFAAPGTLQVRTALLS
jgi:hypothetical protein